MEDSCRASKAARPRNHQAAPRTLQQHDDGGGHGSHDAIGGDGWARLARTALLQVCVCGNGLVCCKGSIASI